MALTISATDTELPIAVANTIERTFLERAVPLTPYLVGHKQTSFAGGQDSKTVKWRRIDEMAGSTTALAEQTGNLAYGMGRSATALSDTTVTAAMAKYGQFVALSEEVEIFENPLLMDEIADVLGEAAGKTINLLQRNIVEGGSVIRYAGNVASDGVVASALDLNDIKSATNTLDGNDARRFTPQSNGSTIIGSTPLRTSYWGICHVDVEIDIRGITGFNPVETYASHTQTVMGEFGEVFGVRWISTTTSTVDAGAGAASAGSNGLRGTSDNTDVYSSMIIARDFHGAVGLGEVHPDGIMMADAEAISGELIVHARGTSGSADPFNETSTMAYKLWHTGAILDTRFGIELRTGASLLS